jgi:WD40 repeat protein
MVGPDGRSIALNTPHGPSPLREFAGWPGSVFFNFFRRQLSPDGATLATATFDEAHLDTIQLWDVATGTLTGELTDGQLNDCLAFSPDGRTLASVRGRLALWDMAKRRLQESPQITATCVQPLAIAPDGAVIAVQAARTAGQTVGAVTLWDLNTGAVRGAVSMLQADALAFSPDVRRLAIADNEVVSLYELPSMRTTMTFHSHVEAPHVRKIKELAWRSRFDPFHFVVNSVRALAFSPDGKHIASGDVYGTVRIWTAETGQESLALVHRNDGAPAWPIVAAYLWGLAWIFLAVRAWRERQRSSQPT